MAPIIGYVCESDPFHDKTAWSGSAYKIREGIEFSGCRVIWIPCHPNGKISKLLKLWNQFWHGKNTMFYHTRFCHKLFAWSVDMSLVEKCDILFFPGGTFMTLFRNFKKPIINFSDNTFRIMCNYYWGKISDWQFKVGDKLEQDAINNSRIVIRGSEWAANSVINHYNFKKEHTYVLRFGANLDESDIIPITPYVSEKINILFSGVDWKRKGGDIAVKTTEILKNMGLDVNLFIVGIRQLPENIINHPLITHVGFLNKSNPFEYKKYLDVVQQSHVLLLPTRAECAGVVFCECSAYGIPSFTYDTGGIPDYVFDGINGYKIDYDLGADAFAHKIYDAITSGDLKRMHNSCLSIYSERLNWRIWGEGFKEILIKEGLWK